MRSYTYLCCVVVAVVISGGSVCLGGALEDQARHRFAVAPALDRFGKNNADEIDQWLDGFAGTPSHKKWVHRSHRQLSGAPLLTAKWYMGEGTNPWVTVPVPADFKGRRAVFVWESIVQTSAGAKPFSILVNGKERFKFESWSKTSWSVEGADGGKLLFDAVWTDRKGDLFGYMRLEAPAEWLTPGEPLQIALTGSKDHASSFPHPFRYADTVAWVRTGRHQNVFCQPPGGVYDGRPISFRFAARPEWAGKSIELQSGTEVLGDSSLIAGDGLSGASITLDSYTEAQLAEPLDVVVAGKKQIKVELDPIRLKAPKLLGRCAQIRQQVQEGKISPDRLRTAAMVLGRGHFLQTILCCTDDGRLWYLEKRSPTPQDAYAQLIKALADFDIDKDIFAERRGRFLSAYISMADGSGQIYALHVPADYDSGRRYALQIYIHGAGGWYGDLPEPPKGADCIYAGADGRGRTGYRGLGELDILEVIKDVRFHYNIDPDRIYITGGSMGGSGSWYMCARYPDIFAAGSPHFGTAYAMYLENLLNVPIWNFHDETDYLVPVDASRVAVRSTRVMGYPVIYTEATGGQHSTDKKDPSWDFDSWMLQQRRTATPPSVRYRTNTPTRGRAYWVEILEFTNPNLQAAIKATVVTDGSANQLFLQFENIDVLAVDLPDKLFDPDKDLQITLNAAPLTVKAPFPKRIYLQRVDKSTPQGSYKLGLTDPRTPGAYRAYTAGGVDHMYTCGEPLLIVKGTGGDERLIEAISKFCDDLSFRATGWSMSSQGQIPIKGDVDLTDDDIERRNLIIVGAASSNTYLAQITDKLPAAEKDGVLTVGSEPYDLKGKVYGLFHYNPQAPKRLILLISSTEAAGFSRDATRDIVSRIADERPFGLILNEFAPMRKVRRIMWDKNWQPAAGAFDEERLPGVFATRQAACPAEYGALCQATGSDLAIYRDRGKDDDPVWDVASARWHDLRADIIPSLDFYTTILTGVQLAAAKERFSDEKVRLAAWPPEKLDGLRGDAEYKVCMYPWQVKRLANALKTNLPNIDSVRVDLYGQIRRSAKLHRPASQ